MKFARYLGWSVLLGLLAAGAAVAAEPTPTQYARIDLTDGRTLKNVELRSYDPATGNVLLVADQKAMLVPISLIPPPFGEHLKKDLPEAGASTAIVATHAVPVPGPSATPPVTQAAPARSVVPARVPAAAGAADSPKALAAHKKAAETRATRYFRFEYKAGSDAIAVTALDIETDQPEAVDGWPGRCRTKGRAFMEFYDSRGRSFSRATSSFEVLTEQKPGEPVKVIDFIRK